MTRDPKEQFGVTDFLPDDDVFNGLPVPASRRERDT